MKATGDWKVKVEKNELASFFLFRKGIACREGDCPKEYATPSAKFKVIVTLPDKFATDSEIELASIIDNSDEFLSEEELNYYMSLDKE